MIQPRPPIPTGARRIVALLLGALLAGVAPAAPPDLVIILADDLGIGDPGCYNADSRISTPNLDQLASDGMRFTDAHTAAAVCTPSRYALLVGRYAWRTGLKSGVLWNGYARSLVDPGRPTLASFLRDRGYRTAAFGKWHLGWDWASTGDTPVSANAHDHVDYARPVTNGPRDLGFERSHLIAASLDMPPYCYLETDRVVVPPTAHTPGSRRRWDGGGGFWRAGAIAPGFDFEDVLPAATENAVAFIEDCAASRRRGDERPFFLYVPLAAPHTPWMPAAPFQGSTPVGWYGDFVAQTDASIGRILAALDRNGLDRGTLVIVTSDNGAHWPRAQIDAWKHDANGGFRGQKADIWEGGHRVPLLVRWPGVVRPATTSAHLVGLNDLFATVAAALGVPPPAGAAEDSVSFLDALRDPDIATARPALVHHSLDGTFALRDGPWKLIPAHLGSGGFTAPKRGEPEADGPRGQLYHLGEDPGETTNRFMERPDVVARLERMLAELRGRGESAPE